MRHNLISTRTAFVLVSVVTLVLIVGSVVLSRIVFKAASSTATVYFSQPTINAKPETAFNVDILADLSAPADITGVQIELNFDPKILKPTDTKPAALWKQVLSRVDNGKLLLVLVPLENKTQISKAATGMELVRLTITSLVEGATNLSLTPVNTLLAVTNTTGAKGVENIVESVVDTQVRVSNTATPTPSGNSLKVEGVTSQDDLVFSSQRIISTSQILTPNSAMLLVRLEHPSRVSVAFGQTASLGNRADYSTRTDQAAIRIAGLEAGTRYYYQVVAEDENATNRVLGQIKSFELPVMSSTNIIERAQLTVFPARSATNTMAYAVFYDKESKVIGGLEPSLQSDTEESSATEFSEVAGLYQAALSSLDAKKQTVHYALLSNGQKYNTADVIFDPSLDTAEVSTNQPLLGLSLDQKTINLILALVAGLFVLGLGFYKLARSR
ncbi:MAG: cohesin domain-containing protein [Candidatus Berkelbacteria bacterium]|nr:cohesin domain-containing protein [Candidatus Berkelbacteria bacterium]MCR4307276.1 cohesin domain-containing protein [Candidatus Berkelbacteria bacterium]